jgi:hypothetical protein
MLSDRITVKKICIFSNSTVIMSYLADWNLFMFAETSKPLAVRQAGVLGSR